ncbi:sugar phosphate isomerase/epimerase [Actinotalea sp. M2MS4P-6]|uniref:sugar phosphate isomerase/epimerase n=1 Tax=Actinotalea sp. M2MS4P-6 TaxID=2983762 RepID=UPI0021E4D001|nr:sugar phosphate isomerase/epimerase [Actinotalea sp. M2MS4P-6]MCV2394380.1 sugar phosphate isomerase/epimerase [Actinotalea sp. M2MS4P-6]
MAHDIRTGASLYSFQDDYFEGKRDLEGCIAAAAELGAEGIETLAEQMMPGFPDLSDEFYATFAGWMEKYGTVSVAHDMFLDTKKYKHRELTHDEMVASLHRDIDHAAKLPARNIRIIVNTPPSVVEAAAPYARDKGVKMGVEIHSPWSFDDDWIKRHLDVSERVGTDVVGCVPDLGIFVRKFPRVIIDRALRDGADPDVVARCVKNYDEQGDTQALFDEVEASGADPLTVNFARMTTHFIDSDPARLTDHVDQIIHIHAKFYEMLDSGEEYSIPYDEIIAALKKGGYRGYLNSEYEGNRHIQDIQAVDAYGQVGLHQQMMKRLIAADDQGE